MITGLGPGGAETFLARLLPRLRAGGIDSSVVVLAGDLGAPADRVQSDGFDLRALHARPNRPDPRVMLRLRAALRAIEPDVVMTWLNDADVLGGLTSRTLRLPVIWNIRQSQLGPEAPIRHRAVAKLAASLSHVVPTRVVYVAEAAKADHEKAGYPSDIGIVIRNGFELERFRPDHRARVELRDELGIPAHVHLIGHVARFHRQKDHRTAIRAFGLLVRKMPDAHMVFCGAGMSSENPEITGWLAEERLTARSSLLGVRNDVQRVLAAVDVAVSSSSYGEGVTNALGEAMCCDVPCVATDCGDARQLIGETGLVVDVGDADAMAEAIWSIATGSVALPSPRSQIAAHFTMDQSAARYVSLIRSLADTRR